MIEIVPAIDLMGGRCVRLSQGDFAQKKEYSAAPAEMAAIFAGAGVRRIHVVDLDGAKAGKPCNLGVLEKIASSAKVDIEWGGGIKTESDVRAAFSAGASDVVCGTVAVREPDTFRRWLELFPRMVLGADVRGSSLATDGWMKDSGKDISEMVRSFPALKELVVTQISRDGMLAGPDVELYRRLKAEFPSIVLTASGGVGNMADIAALQESGADRAIVGKAIYENRITMEEIALWCAKG